MLDIEKWRRRILKAWEKKVRKNRFERGPKESVTRWQCVDLMTPAGLTVDRCRVNLLIWDFKHSWIIVHNKRVVTVACDEPISQDAVNRWLAKTAPIE